MTCTKPAARHPVAATRPAVAANPTNLATRTPRMESQLRKLSNNELLFRMSLATRGERAMTIKILHHLNEIERRKLYLDQGCSSLFDYCTRRLKYSSSAAARRIHSARCIKRHSDVLEMLRDRDLSLSTISLIAPILDCNNKATILERVRGKSYREVEHVASEYRPPVALRDRVRPVRVRVSEPVDADVALLDRALSNLVRGDATPGAGRARVGTQQKMFVQFLASEELIEKFEEARALLAHRCGDGSFAEVLDVLVTEFVERHSPEARRRRREQRKSGAARPRRNPGSPAAGPEHSPGENESTNSRRHAVGTIHSRRRECKNNNLARRDARPGQPAVDPRKVIHRRLVRPPLDHPHHDPPQPSRHVPAGVRDEVFVRRGRRTRPVKPATLMRSAQPYGRRADIGKTHHEAFLADGMSRVHPPRSARTV